MLLWVAALKCSNEDLFDVLQRVKSDIASGRLMTGTSAITSLFSQYPDLLAVRKTYFEHQISLGNYSEVTQALVGDTKLVNLYQKALNGLELSKNMDLNIQKLAELSPYSKNIQRHHVEFLISKKELLQAENKTMRLKTHFPNEGFVILLQGYLSLASNRIQAGIDSLKAAGALRLAQKLQFAFNQGSEISQLLETSALTLSGLENAIKLINDVKDSVILFKDRELGNVVLEPMLAYILRIVIGCGLFLKRDVLIYAEQLVKVSKDEKDRARLIRALILNQESEKAQKELDSRRFVNNQLYTELSAEIQQLKERKERDKKQQQKSTSDYQNGYNQYQRNQNQYSQQQKKQQHQQQQHQKQQQQSQKTDPSDRKGYYKLFGVPKTASQKDIKKAYMKLVRKNNPDPFKGKDEKKYNELTEKMMKINEAKDVLLDDKQRQVYDSGIDERAAESQHDFYHNDFGNIFDMFFGGGGGNAFFGGGGGNAFFNGGNGQRTYTYTRFY